MFAGFSISLNNFGFWYSPSFNLRSRLLSVAFSFSLERGFSFIGNPHSSLAIWNMLWIGFSCLFREQGFISVSRSSRYLAKSLVDNSFNDFWHIGCRRKAVRMNVSYSEHFLFDNTVSMYQTTSTFSLISSHP
jgi:hypothetical protein